MFYIMGMGDKMRTEKPFLSVREVADYLDIDYKTVYRLVRKGEIPAVKVGGMYRVRRSELEGYLDRQTVAGEPAAEGRGLYVFSAAIKER